MQRSTVTVDRNSMNIAFRRNVWYAVILALATAWNPHPVSTQTAEPLRRGFDAIELGMGFREIQTVIQEHPSFSYRGEPDVSLAPGDGERVIDSSGRGFLERGLFQFHDDQLYILALYLDRRRLDYFLVFNQLEDRYGEARDLDPNRAVWEDETTRIELERPLTVRYLDLETFFARRDERRELQALEDVTREQFLEKF